MENQEIQSEPNNEPKKTSSGNEPERKEFGGGGKESEVDTGQLHDNQELDLDRTGPNEPGQGSEGHKIHAGEGTSRGYESNTPDIDEETLKYGRPSGGGDESRV